MSHAAPTTPTHRRPPPPRVPSRPASPAPPPPPPPQPLLLTVRFSAAVPDLELDIAHAGATTVAALKHLIRERLEAYPEHRRRRLRFIHGGKILPDGAVLGAVLRAPAPPPPRREGSYASGAEDTDGGGKGKGKGKGKSVPGRPVPPARIYVNCSIGDELPTADLEAEALAAQQPPSSSALPSRTQATTTSRHVPTATTTRAPRGFDRLLAAGLSAGEVAQLRAQFRGIHGARYAPDAQPSPDSFRRMEDAWMDDATASLSGGGSPFTGAGTGTAGDGITDSDEAGGLVALVDVLVRGVLTGFVWPLGSAGWLVREEGMASGRWRFMVGVGVLFSVLIGVIRAISGDK
ncbi:DUF2407 C-terminal domain-containing protein [Xylariomycetidae sp. FL0641]|nr:DUF2407 C-terminal domain-containing protein [Xylariomycetidae sp. FL0641]